MTPNPRSINHNATVRETAEVLRDHELHIAPVIDDSGRPIGVVSRTDLLEYWGRRRNRLTAVATGETLSHAPADLPGDEITVLEIMTPVVFGVRMNASLESIVEKTTALEVRYLFVTDRDGVLVGTVSVFDVLRRLARREIGPARTQMSNIHVSAALTRNTFDLASAMPP
jgi:CBS-domain-containing membrane protein